MKKILLAAACIALAHLSASFASQFAGIPWDRPNAEILRTLDKPAVVVLLNDLWDNSPFSVPEISEIGEFTWADLQGDGRLELIATVDVNGRAFFNALVIYRRESSGKVSTEELEGWMIRDLHAVIRDLNGDGKKELVVPTVLVSHSTADTMTWPAVYRLENGKYVEASRDFPAFYDGDVLPKITGKIEETRGAIDKIATSESPLDLQYKESLQGKLADLITERDKILRLIGRDPTAGLEDARTWMNSSNPDLLQDAAVTFKDMGGHEDEARAAGEAYRAHTWGGH